MPNKRAVSALVAVGFATFLATVIRPAAALADSGSASFNYLVASGLLCPLDPSACPAVARAANGDTIVITGAGTLDIHAKSVTGGGAFTHKNSAGATEGSGLWTATELLSFNSYGTSPGVPPNFEGGLALIRVDLLSTTGLSFFATLEVNCSLGKAPKGHAEDFVRLAVVSGPNFNSGVSGFTLFIRQP